MIFLMLLAVAVAMWSKRCGNFSHLSPNSRYDNTMSDNRETLKQ